MAADLLLRLQSSGFAKGRGLRDQHQADASLAVDVRARTDGPACRPTPDDRRADAADHHHAQLLHDAPGAGWAVRPGAAHPARDPQNIERAYHLDEPSGSSTSAISAACCTAISVPPIGPRTSRWPNCCEGAPASLKVGGLAVLLATFRPDRGVAAALRHNSWADYSVMALAMVGIAIPSFVMAPL